MFEESQLPVVLNGLFLSFFFNSGEDWDVKKNSDGLAIFSSIAEVKLNAGSRSKKG